MAAPAGVGAPRSQQCLKFMHIPKTGGTSIEQVISDMPKEQRPFHTITEQYYDLLGKVVGITARQTFDEVHSLVDCQLPGPEASVSASRFREVNLWFDSVPFANLMTRMPDGQYCQWMHTPPQYNKGVAAFFSASGCTTFCVVRDPLQRLISTYKFWCFGPCSVRKFEDFVELLQKQLRHQPHSAGCHFVKQVEFVYGAHSMNSSTHQWCDRILRFEELEQDFDALMQDHGSSVRLAKHHVYTTEQCEIDPAAISTKTKDTIYDLFREDYEAFGYPRP